MDFKTGKNQYTQEQQPLLLCSKEELLWQSIQEHLWATTFLLKL